MSRRRGEFEHRTSIFEGAFRAWSHLGGLEPELLESRPPTELDPLNFVIENDPRLDETKKGKKEAAKNPDGTKRREFPYEPLPRSGLAHPYVQAILSPWLGPDADHDAIQLGLTTLRTWWQHRRKGESGSAIAALGTDKMRGVVEGYTRHFFSLAHCLVVNDKEHPPRSLHTKMKNMEKKRKLKGKGGRMGDSQLVGMSLSSGMPTFAAGDPAAAAHQAAVSITSQIPQEESLSPLERLHLSQQMKLRENGVHNAGSASQQPVIDMKGKCVPGKIDLPGIAQQVNHHATQLAHRGGMGAQTGEYGDPNTTPVVFISPNGDIQIAMAVDGITCAHCVKIVETVLKGCNGNKSPIEGLLDAAADRTLNKVLIKLDKSSNAKRVAFESARNLAMVGYAAKALEMSIVDAGGDKKATMDLGKLSTAFEVVANTDPADVFDWSLPCTCPDNGIVRDDCSRHSQMNTRIFEAFKARQEQVQNYMAGCGSKYGMDCTCGPGCKCPGCTSEHCHTKKANETGVVDACCGPESTNTLDDIQENTNVMGPPQPVEFPFYNTAQPMAAVPEKEVASRNPSFISFGGNTNNTMRHMSITSETTFGRAMSGLSALSIDWENMEDFDVNVDHSAHIDNTGAMGNVNNIDPLMINPSPLPVFANTGGRRSSLRRSITAPSSDHGAGSSGMQVSFQV